MTDMTNMTEEEIKEEAKKKFIKELIDTGFIDPLIFIFVCLMVIGMVRHFLAVTKIPIPYTSVTFLFGCLCGYFGKKPYFKSYFFFMLTPPQTWTGLLMPPIIFEAAFSMDTHMFMKVAGQAMVLAGPGVVINTLLISGYAMVVLSTRKFDYGVATVFSAMLSSTDPVAVAMVRKCGVPNKVTTLIEGESLLNNATAFLVYFFTYHLSQSGVKFEKICEKLAYMCVVNPLLGYLMGQIAVMWLMRVYKDKILQLIITVSFVYFTFNIANYWMQTTGIMAVVVFGLVISYEKSSFNPEVEEALRKFWSLLSYYCNGFTFIVTGSVVAFFLRKDDVASISYIDAGLYMFTYFFVIIFRLVMISVLSPILARTGYGLDWKTAVALTCGGFKGALSLICSMRILKLFNETGSQRKLNSDFDKYKKDGVEILVHASIVVQLTQICNALILPIVLGALGVNKVTRSRVIAMGNAVSQLRTTVMRSTAVQRSDKYLVQADWKWVKQNAVVKGPFAAEEKDDEADKIEFSAFRKMTCPECDDSMDIEPTKVESKEMAEEARQRMLKSLKCLYWTYFEHSAITRRTVQLLIAATNDALDKPGMYIDATYVKKKYMDVPKFVENAMGKLRQWSERFKTEDVSEETIYLAGQTVEASVFRKICITVYMSPNFQPFILIFTICQLPILLWVGEFPFKVTFAVTIALVYLTEAVIQISALSFKRYIKVRWHQFDLFLVFFAFACVIMGLVFGKILGNLTWVGYVSKSRSIIYIRLFEMYPTVLKMFVTFLRYLEGATAESLYNAYDLGYGYVASQEEISKQTSFAKDYKEAGTRLLLIAEENILEMNKAMNYIQSSHPGVTVALKSHKVATKVLNDVDKALNDLRQSGMIDDTEYTKLSDEISKMKQNVIRAPKTLAPAEQIEGILGNIEWIQNEKLLRTLLLGYIVRDYAAGETINDAGQFPTGISIVTTGIVKVGGRILDKKINCLPNTDSLVYFQGTGAFFDFVSSNHCLGLVGYLVNDKFATTSVCETSVRVIHISDAVLKKAEVEMGPKDSLTYTLWRLVSIKMSLPIFMEQTDFEEFGADYLTLLLEKAVFPDLSSALFFEIESAVRAVVLVQGHARDPHAGVIYIGPEFIPPSVQKLSFDDDPFTRPRVVLLILADPSYTLDPKYQWVSADETTEEDRQATLCLFHCVQHRRATMGALFKDGAASEYDLNRRQTKKASSAAPLLSRPSFFA